MINASASFGASRYFRSTCRSMTSSARSVRARALESTKHGGVEERRRAIERRLGRNRQVVYEIVTRTASRRG